MSVLGLNKGLAQDTEKKMPPGIENLPIGLSPEEEALMHLIGIGRDITPPPTGPVRAAAEWEECVGVFCLWDNADLMNELQKENDVYIITTNSSWWISWLNSHGIPTTNFKFLNAPTNTWWVRDYGPWFIWDGNNDFGLVDTIYNRPRPLDDVIPEKISQSYGIPYYGVDLVQTGGNYYTDGYGNAFSSRLVYKENPDKTENEVNQLMYDYLGITRYVARELDYDIEHFDTFGKLLAPDTLLWGDFPDDTTPWIYSEAALKYYKTLQSPYGWPYKIHRMPLWDVEWSWTGYINSLQTMKKIITCKYNTLHDNEAKAIYEQAAPGYNVVNVDDGGTYWGDSIHCRTRNFIRGETIRIYAMPHWESTDDDTNPYVVKAEVIPDNSTKLNGNPVIYWNTTGGAPFDQVTMWSTGNPNEFSGAIPAQPHGTMVSYYIHAEDLAGNTKDCPIVAPDGMFTIQVDDDTIAPELDHDVIHGLTLDDWPYTVKCTAVDNTGIPTVILGYKINGVLQPLVTMTRKEGTFVFSGSMSGSVSLGDLIAYTIVAIDGASPPNIAASPSPAVGWNFFTINPKSSILVIELDETPDSGSVLVNICDDLGLNVHYTTSWPTYLSNYDLVMICLGMSPTNTELTFSQANELVSFLNAGGSAYMEGGNCWAQDTNKNVYRPYFGIFVASSGSDIPSSIQGTTGEITEGMSFGYYGERYSSDHLMHEASARAVLKTGPYTKAVTYSTGTYNTVGASFQMGSLVEANSPSHIKYLTALYLDHLGMDIDLVIHKTLESDRLYTFDIKGDPAANYALFYALAPGYFPYGLAGIVQIDLGTLTLMNFGLLPADGKLSFDVLIPDNPSLSGREIYFQAYELDAGSGHYYLTNRDRLTIDID
jgi:agmatine/peptidylarginine deiminase